MTIEPGSGRLFRRKGLLQQGFSDAEIRTMSRRRGWQRLAPGIYAEPADRSRSTEYRLRVGAVASRSPSLIVSHHSAAALHGLPLFRVPTRQVQLSRPGRNGSCIDAGRRVHAVLLPDDDVVELGGLLVTSVARTLFDLGRTQPFETAVVAVDFALHRGLVTALDLRGQLAKVRDGRGVGAARRAISFADGRSESVGESRTRVLFHRFQLPIPVPQLQVFSERGRLLGRADLGVESHALLCEFDGMAKYDELLAPGQSARMAIAEEKVREDRFREHGWAVVRLMQPNLSNHCAQQQTVGRIGNGLALGKRSIERGQLVGSSRPVPYIGILDR